MRGVYYLCAVKTKINTPLMYEVLDKDTIKSEILPFLSVAKRGYVTKSDLVEVIQCILYKLKTGCQWHMLTGCACVCVWAITLPSLGSGAPTAISQRCPGSP